MQIASVSPTTCHDLLTTQAVTHDGVPIGRHSVLPVTERVWQDYYRGAGPSHDEPWWAFRNASSDTFDGILFVDPNLAVFQGHFPGNPILPGVVQIDWAVTASQEAFEQTPAGQFRGMSQIKFKVPIAPASWLKLELSLSGSSVKFEFSDGASVRTQGQLQYNV